jgi:hypothetical protein
VDAPEFVNAKAAVASVLMVTFPKSWLAAETLSAGSELPAVPVSTTGGVGPLLPWKFNVPLAFPALLPLNHTVKLAFCPDCMEMGNWRPETENCSLETLASVNVTAVELVLVTEAICETFLPTPVVPKSTAAGTTCTAD